MIKDGERIAVSSRVAELDQIMPQYLGVSKAVLDNVIFCHQDESLWPMSEPSVLKKKFDEIFEALKYTKAIDNIKVLRKKQNEELAKFKISEQHAKEDKDKGDRVLRPNARNWLSLLTQRQAEKRSRDLSDELEKLRTQAQDFGDQIKAASQKAEDAWRHCSQFDRIVAQLEGKRIDANAREENIRELKEHITLLTGSDGELRTTLEQFEERVAAYENELKIQKDHYTEIETHKRQANVDMGEKQKEHGRYQAEKAHYERQLGVREGLVKETARRHKIRGYDHDLDDDQVRDFMERITRMARDQNAAFENARRETQQELREAQLSLDKLNERKSALNQSRENARSQITHNDRKINSQQSTLDQINTDEGATAILESGQKDVESRLQKSRSELEGGSWDKQIQEAEAELRTLDESVEKLNNELVNATKHAGDTARLDYLRKSLKESQLSLNTMKGAHGERISQMLGTRWENDNLEIVYQQIVDQKIADIKDIELQRDGTSRELEQVEFKLASFRGDLKSKMQELQKAEKHVREVTEDEDPSEFPDVLATLEANRDVMKSDIDNFSSLKAYYSECLRIANNNGVCRLCERTFKSEKEKSKLTVKIEKLMSDAAQEAVAKELVGVESDLARVRQANSSYETWMRLSSTEIPHLEQEIKRLSPSRESLISQIEEQDKIVSDRQSAKRDIVSLSKTIANMAKYNSDITNFNQQIDEMTSKQSQTGMSRGLEEINQQIKQTNERSRGMKTTLSKHSSDRERARIQVSALESELSDIKDRLNKALYQLRERATIVSQLEELRAFNKEQRELINRVEKELQGLIPQISQAQARYDDINQRANERERELRAEVTALQSSANKLKLADQDISSFVDRNGPNQLAKVARELEVLKQDYDHFEAEQRQVTVTINKVATNLRQQDESKRSIVENQRYRTNLRALEGLRAEIEDLEGHNAEADRARYKREADKWEIERSRLHAESSSLMGQMKSKDDQLAQLIEDWNTDYKDAAYKFKEWHIKVEATKAAVEDLGRYGGALDKAIMKYHSLKMEEINRIVEELWKRTYQGTDVDTILIRSDNENVKGNKSYNYRVCMVKQDAEMDMRGRCSAGQRVLASIIIRLALAECFGTNCGLIALDEPTTNLDRENIRALAESLHDIIKARKQQSNFQLIVITHDEEFLRFMHCADFCDSYYRVSRNERQKSIIERQSIAEVME